MKQTKNSLDNWTTAQEAKTMVALSHTNIVRYLGLYHPEDGFYVVSEFADKGDLLTLVRERGQDFSISEFFSM